MENKYKYQEKWQKKAGLISKSYKLLNTVVEDFANACKLSGTSQAKQLTIMMNEFSKKILNDKKE